MSQKLHLQTSRLILSQQEEKERNEKIYSLYLTGSYSYSSLARIYKISKQRIAEIIKRVVELKDKKPKTNEEMVSEIDPRGTPDQW